MMNNFIHKIKNVFRWIPLLWKDYDWDYGFMLEIERKKLSNMIRWYEENDYGVSVDGKRNVKMMRIALNCLNIILDGDWWTIDYPPGVDWLVRQDSEQYYKIEPYINMRTWKRFIPYMTQEKIDMHPKLWSIELREEKAWRLYNKIREQYMRNWWD